MKAKKWIALGMTAVLGVSLLGSGQVTTAQTKAQTKTEKDETVYAFTDAEGNVEKVLVSDWLKNMDNANEITDRSDLKDIVNVKGDETYEQKEDNSLVWKAEGADIYYQGTTTKELPLGVAVSYQLDGTDISADDLVGKSGTVKITLNFTNTTKEYVPFTIISAALLDGEKYKNVTGENIKVLSDGDKLIVTGLAIPGLKKELDTDFDIPEEVVIEAEVTEYEPLTIYNVATSGLLSDISFDDEGKITELGDAMKDLTSASKELVDGSKELSDGLATLEDKTAEYIAGVDQVVAGVDSLYDGTKQLKSGATELKQGITDTKNGMTKIVESTTALQEGNKSLAAGVTQFDTAMDQLAKAKEQENAAYDTLAKTVENNEAIITALEAAGVDSQLVEKLKQNTAGQKQIAEGLKKSGTQISAGITQAAAGADSIVAGATQLTDGLSQFTDAHNRVLAALTQLETGSGKLSVGIDSLLAGALKLQKGGKTLGTASSQFKSGISSAAKGGKTLYDGMKKFDKEGIQELSSLYNDKLKGVVDNLENVTDAAESYKIFSDVEDGVTSEVKFIIKVN
jgi:putative membrane protein